MKNFLTATLFLPIVLSLLSGCRDKSQVSPFVPSQDVVNVPPEGGMIEVPCPGITAESEVGIISEYGWVHDFDCSTADIIRFTVDANEEECSRMTNVEVTTIASQEKHYFKVIQEADTIADFRIDILDVTETSMAFSILPKDKEMTYVYMFTEKSYWDTFDSDEEWYQDDMTYFRNEATRQGLSIEQYLNKILKKGDYESGFVENLLPGTEYVLYAYGLTPQGNRLTDICYDSTATLTAEKIDISFDISLDIKGPMVDMSVVPSDDSQAYYFGVFDKTDVSSDEDIIKRCEQNFNDMIAFYGNQAGLSPEEVMAQIVSYGPDSYLFELEENTSYVAFAVAVDMRGLVISDPSVREFVSGEVTPSDNVISVEISQVTSRTAHYNISVTNEDQYVFLLDLASEWEGLTEGQMLERLVSQYDLSNNTRTGNDEGDMTGLEPGTEYVTFAFGCVAGIPTTDLVCTYFATKEAEISDAVVNFIYDGYFSGDDVEAAYPDIFQGASGYAVLKLNVTVDPEGTSFYYNIFAGDLSSVTDIQDDVLIDELMYQGIHNEPYSWFVIPFGEPSTAVGVAVDASGNFGQVTRTVIAPSPDGVLPFEDFELNNTNITNNKYKAYEKVADIIRHGRNDSHAVRLR